MDITKIDGATSILNTCSVEELHVINRHIIRLLKSRAAQNTATFYPGEAVYWIHTKNGARYDGKVVKVMQKNVTVDVNGMMWRVSGNILKKVV
jgi:ribosomal protein L35AE/L33A